MNLVSGQIATRVQAIDAVSVNRHFDVLLSLSFFSQLLVKGEWSDEFLVTVVIS
jgi:hypothetical protein